MDYCILLKYWVYDQIKKFNKNGKKDIDVFVLTEKLRKLQYTIRNEESVNFECYDDYSDYFSNWEEEKALYEYFVNFKEIIDSSKPDNTGENKYIPYIQYIVKLYKKKTTEEGCCNTKCHHPCDHYFNCDPEYDPENLLLKLKAKEKGYALVSCYNIGKKYPNVENIFRPTKKRKNFILKRSKQKAEVSGEKICHGIITILRQLMRKYLM
ncbi:VIR-like CYIR protein [Plasmodium cynomolgi strain B]|uniref:VIR-like CYIR protein n=1 Tax=Plasmodium cynomolgi (strain B) TaxID=1120755 RepID=K6UTE0_PLACD|nr:VIR-like CYIR protein [Plasmodium cynomolgi strain B]GAB65365.1 VIR-like CYIR protein [Plasmodium cynomolgi strain B]